MNQKSENIAPAPWWSWPGALQRFVSGLVEAELTRLRPGRAVSRDWASGSDLVADFGADSLELMALTATLAQTLQLEQAEMLNGLLADTRIDAWVALTAVALDAGSGPAAIAFRSSGSAGAPKVCVHTLATLWQEVAALAALLPARTRIVSAVPAHHIYGFLFTVLLPQQMRVPLLDVSGQLAPATWQGLGVGDLVIGYPEFWQAALAGADMRGCPGNIVGVSSTAPCPDPLAAALEAAGLARLVQVYGSSETGGVGWRDRAAAPYRRLPHWRRDPHDDMVLLRAMPDGASVAYPLQDRLAWDDAGGFVPAGRIDAAVQVGGVNVYPARVSALLRSHPLVADAAVRLMRPDEGGRLKAFIVATGAESEHALTAQLEALLREQTVAAERPASYTFGAALPRQRNGKLADWIIDDGA